MLEWIEKGGYNIMIPLLLLSVIAVAFIIERMWTFNRRVPNDESAKKYIDGIMPLVKKGDREGLFEYFGKHPGLFSFIFSEVIKKYDNLLSEELTKEQTRVILLSTCEVKARNYLEEYLSVLNLIGVVSPLLGLLGTIFGMINSFAAISQAGVGDPQAVAKGINEALITTATGLTIAIPYP
jgi:biopolymer transport protein ExbB